MCVLYKDAIQTRLDLMEKDIDSLKKENENQKRENVQMKSLVQHLQDLLYSGSYSNGQAVDDEFSGMLNKRSARSTTLGAGKRPNKTNATTLTKPYMLSTELYKLQKIVSGEIYVVIH